MCMQLNRRICNLLVFLFFFFYSVILILFRDIIKTFSTVNDHLIVTGCYASGDWCQLFLGSNKVIWYWICIFDKFLERSWTRKLPIIIRKSTLDLKQLRNSNLMESFSAKNKLIMSSSNIKITDAFIGSLLTREL